MPLGLNPDLDMIVIPSDDDEDPAYKDWVSECEPKFGGLGIKNQAKTVSLVKVAGVKPINLRLREKSSAQVQLKPRRYQEELFLKTLESNVIIYLGTGLGKTFIIVLFLNSPMIDSSIYSGKKVAFLAPTQDLVSQQAEYLYTKVPYTVRVYCGRSSHLGIHIDMWQEDTWKAELKEVDILCMTPQIFSSAISVGFLKWDQFSAVIFDEAHHAATSTAEKKGKKSGSPYSQMLKHFNLYKQTLTRKPRLIGLTASLINNMPKDVFSIEQGIRDLESKLSATCVTDISAIESKPQMVIYKYTKPNLSRDNDKIIRILSECQESLEDAVSEKKSAQDTGSQTAAKREEQKEFLAYINRIKLSSHGFSIKPTSFYKIIRQLIAIRKHSGLWTFANICFNLHLALEKHIDSPFLSQQIKPMYADFSSIMKYLVTMVKNFLGPDPTNYLLGYVQPKVLCLLEILKNEYTRVFQNAADKATFSCIVFVKSRIDVYALCGFLQKVSTSIPEYEFIKADYAIGLAATQASKWACITKRKSADQASMLERFRSNSLNVIVTTSVLEEGIDLPVCSTVIRFDSADTFRVYVQSRGRARQQKSTFVAMCDEDSLPKTHDALIKFNDFEDRVKQSLSGRSRQILVPRAGNITGLAVQGATSEEEDVFIDKEKGIRVDPSMARIILNMYCSRLSSRSPFSDGFMFEREQNPDGSHITTLFFPPGAAIKEGIKGGSRDTTEAADCSAAVAAYRALFLAGELDDHGIPIRMTEEHIDKILGKHNLQPDFSALSRDLEGEVNHRGAIPYHTFPWKLFNIGDSLARGFMGRTYNLYRMTFIAYDDEYIRKDAKRYLEKKTLGIIVDSSRNHKSWPRHVYSHYGQLTVEYELLREKFEVGTYREHNDLASYTYRFATNYWKVGRLPRHDFNDKCLFYLVPLNHDDRIRWDVVRAAFHTKPVRDFEPNDIVRFGRHYRRYPEDHSKSYVVKDVHYNMNIYSKVPGSRYDDTFDRLLRKNFGDSIPAQDISRPIIEVRPISQELARSTEGKKIDVNQTTATIFLPEQYLETYEADVATSYQAYLLPVIIYKIYLTTLSSDLDSKFQEETRDSRQRVVHLQTHKDKDDPLNSSPGSQEGTDSGGDGEEDLADNFESNLDEAMDVGDEVDSESEESFEEDVHEDDDLESSSSSAESSDLSEDSSDDEPKPSDRYRDILARQKFNLNNRGDSGMEKWDMSEYNVSDLKPLTIEIKSFQSSQKYLDTNPRMPEDYTWISPIRLLNYNITTNLSNFRKGILANCDYQFEEEVYHRAGKIVDLSIKPPLSFDRNPFPEDSGGNRDLEFLEAMTQRKSGEQPNLEALESVGDSYLKYCVSVVLFQRIDRNEGQLTFARSRLVSNKHFCHLAKKKKLGQYAVCRKFDPEIISSLLGGRVCFQNTLRSKDLADMFEALVGTCLLNRGEYEAIMALKWLGLNLFDDNSFAELHQGSVTFTKPRTAFYDDDNTELMIQSKKRVERFQDIIAYEFADKSYLVQAFTHASSPLRCTDTYERLEFLGDAILDYLVTMTLYKKGDFREPGQITSSRSALVNNCTFAKLAIQYKFDIFIQHANQQLYDELNCVNEYAKSEPSLEFMDEFRFDKISKVLGDVFESVAGAIYVDSGCSLDAVYDIYFPIMKDIIEEEIKNPTKNPITQLYELFAGQDRVKFEFVKSEADVDNPLTTAICKIYNLPPFYGEGYNKSQAKKRAVAEALANLPSQQELNRLDEEYKEKLRKEHDAGSSRGPRSRRGGASGAGRGRGRGAGRGRWMGGQHGRGNYPRVANDPYPRRSYNRNFSQH